MAISIICPSCQKKLSAPDSAAGKKAKCPACGTIVVVPQIVQDAEEIGATEVPSSGPPVTQPAAGLPNWLDEMMPPATPPPAQAADDGGQPRRPCPECGELIVADAAKCRFCGAVFDPGLKRQSAKKKRSAQDENLTTSDWVICILCGTIGCIGGIIYAIQGKPKGMKMVGIHPGFDRLGYRQSCDPGHEHRPPAIPLGSVGAPVRVCDVSSGNPNADSEGLATFQSHNVLQ